MTMRITTVTRYSLLAALVLTGACHDITASSSLPAGVSNPKVFHTAEGAVGMYNTAIYGFEQQALTQVIVATGILSDEMHVGTLGGSVYSSSASGDERLDERSSPQVGAGQSTALESGAADNAYTILQMTRNNAIQARGALLAYAPDSPPALRGQLYATQAFAEIMLADLFCSGVPLGHLDFDKDFTYEAGSTTAAVYEHAVALFDSALVLATDSARILNAARVGKGRALLALGRYAEASAAVADVPDTFSYDVFADWSGWFLYGFDYNGSLFKATVADREGNNGFPFLSGDDQRTASYVTGQNVYGADQYFPSKYDNPQGQTTVVVADATEAQLIRAEAALAAGQSQWLDLLNALRAAASPAMPALQDPGTTDARVTMLFNERAAWLFATGHRQGDLRRLIRQYGRSQSQVYPTGTYPGDLGAYGTDVNAPIPAAEWANPKFTGCLNRGA